jgi:hypothetical protein
MRPVQNERDWTEVEIRALPAETVVLTFFLAQYDETRDNVLKWMCAPWQGVAELEKTVDAHAKTAPRGERSSLSAFIFTPVPSKRIVGGSPEDSACPSTVCRGF